MSSPEAKYVADPEELDFKIRTPSPSPEPSPPTSPKPKGRRPKYNIFSRLFFFWLDPLFCYVCRNDLKQSDLNAHPEEADSKKLTEQFNTYWKQELERKVLGKKPRLWMVLAKSFKWRFLVQAILAFIEVAMLVGQSVLLGLLVDYFSDVSSNQVTMDCFNMELPGQSSARDAYLAAFGLLLLALSVAFLHAHYALVATKIGMMSRIMTTSAVYNKMLVLSQSTVNDLTTGHVINVVSNDVQRFDLAFLFLPFLWIAPLHIIVFTYLVYQEVGWVVFVTLFFFIIQIPAQLVLAKIFTRFRFKSADLTDKRVRVMNEVITGIRVIKMYAWENAFKKLVSGLRKHEVRLIKIGGMIRTLTASFNFGVALTLFMSITFLTYVGTGHELTPRRVIVTLSLLTFLRNISASFLIRSVFLLFEAKVAFTRIQHILELEELTPAEIMAIGKATLKGRKKLDRRLSVEGGFFRQESPWLPGMRKIKSQQPVELTSVSAVKDPPGGDQSSESPAGDPPDDGGVPGQDEASGQPPDRESPARESASASPPPDKNGVSVSGLTASWKGSAEEPTLTDISFELTEESSLLAVVGKVGAGKSSLLQCLLGELKALKGSLEVVGRVSYASQTPWVFSGTVRENILFGSELVKDRYDRVVEACGLRQDMTELPRGDLTLVGERGVTLSGGQKARVNLARAVYHEADIYLLDDPLSAVDTAVGKQIFEKCICGLLKDCEVVLVTHQVQFAIRAQQLLLLNEGKVQFYHSQEELQEKGLDQHQLLKLLKEKNAEFVYDDVEEDVDGEDEDDEEEDDDYFPRSPPPLHHQDSITEQTYRSILSRTESFDPRRGVNVEDSITAYTRQRYTSQHSREDNLLSSLVATHAGIIGGGSLYSAPSDESLNAKEEVDDPDSSEDKAHGTISMGTYFRFFRAGSNYVFLFIILVLFVLAEGGVVASDSFLSEWSNCAVINISIFEMCNRSVKSICYLNDDQRMGIYGGITAVSIILNFIRTALFYLVCVNASRVLHNRMFRALIRTTIRFFDTNPSGRVLNRFSKDIGFLDDLLPHTFLEYLFLLLRFLAVLVTASYGNPYVLIPAAAILLAFILLRWYFLKTSRDVKRLEAIARSPVYSHFSITLQGLSTIRTLRKQDVTEQLFHQYQNQHTQGWYLYLVTSRWFGLRLDIMSALYLGVIAFISVPLAQNLDAGIVGLGLAYTIALAGILQYCVRQSAEVENIMISTERIMSYGKLEPEAALETQPPNLPPPADWPQKGGLTLSHVNFRYDSSLPYVIRDLNFSVRSTEKVGIVGRTGAGKSSLISVLYRLAEPEGNIEIDAVHTKAIGLHDLRPKMSIIPQDPFLFSGSVRYNLDPCKEYSDDRLWEVIGQVQLKHVITQLPEGLSAQVAEGGSNFSVGQRQLVCLARAMLKETKILIMDEATANVDPGTDETIQEIIRTCFRGCTVLTIAHRLNTIMDSDRILVMSSGQVAEYDTPYKLLQRKSSLLYKMVEKTGHEAARELHDMVKQPE